MKTNLQVGYKSQGYNVRSIMLVGGCVQVEMRWDNRFKPVHSACGCKMRICRKTLQEALDMPMGSTQATIISYEAVQGFCPHCKQYETVRPLDIQENGKATSRFMRYVSALCRHVPASRVPELITISAATAWRYDFHVLSQQIPPPAMDGVEAILIDEKFLGKSKGFVTVVLNARNGELLHLAQGRDRESIDSFFEKLTSEQKQSILAVGIDRSGVYKAAVQAHLPDADIVFDKFHLVANYNDVIDDVRRRTLREANAKQKKFIKGQRYNLLRNPENLTESSREQLDKLLKVNYQIQAAYLLKDFLKTLWDYSSKAWAEKRLLACIQIANETGVPELVRFARGLLKAKDAILAYCKHRITSAKIESFNNSIQRVLCKTCGISNMSYLFLKLRQISLQS